MTKLYRCLFVLPLLLTAAQAQEVLREWVEPTTGHRVIRLSDEPGSASFYFHQNAYTASGDKIVISTRKGLSTIDLRTRKIEPLIEVKTGAAQFVRQTDDAMTCGWFYPFAQHFLRLRCR